MNGTGEGRDAPWWPADDDGVDDPWADVAVDAPDLTDEQRAALADPDQPQPSRLRGLGDADDDQPAVPRLGEDG